MPRFVGPVVNVTVPLGREAILSCSVENLVSYKVAWVRVETQTILTIHTHVITRSHRIQLTHTDSWTWNLHIKNVKESDRGYYMCQINTDPMMSQNGYLQVVVPPDILDYPTSTDMVVREGANVTLQCAVTGFPKPTVTWQREDKSKITYGEHLVESVEGEILNLTKVNRLHMGAYLAIANNGIPPKVSRRILIIVHFPPMIWVPNQLVGAMEGDDVTLECHSEAYPKSINYWTKLNGDIIVSGEKYEPILEDNTYKVTMRLTIRGVSASDYGTYVCLSKNSLGETDGQIKLYPLIPSTVAAKATTLPSSISAVSPDKVADDSTAVRVTELKVIPAKQVTEEKAIQKLQLGLILPTPC
ncbi:Lachesin, partial [Orchesella cincta]